MALLTVTEAARLARRSRASIYRDLEKGRLDKVFTADGALKIDSVELARTYGEIGRREERGTPGASPAATDKAIQAVLRQVEGRPEEGDSEALELATLRERLAASEHRIALLERIAGLEKAARLAADVTWRERLEAKDEVIKALTLVQVQPQRQSPVPPREEGWPTWRPADGMEKRAIN
ncbi:MAG TPA: hypothetical protein VF774_24105 [Pseudoduganella sp.]|jgi:hypothetical protein